MVYADYLMIGTLSAIVLVGTIGTVGFELCKMKVTKAQVGTQ